MNKPVDRIRLSVIVPTYNRSHLLPATLESLLNQTVREREYEVLVCDNASTDETWAVCTDFESRYPSRVRALREPRQGVHYARNRCGAIARGEILYFTDDDMVADETALANLLKAFELHPRIAVATGRVLPKWEVAPPPWVEKHCRNGLLSLHDPPELVIVAPYDVGVYSCHEAIRSDVFRQTAGFHPENTAGEWIGDGETGLNERVRSLGWNFAFVGDSVTHHHIPASRMTQQYLDKRFANQGNCDSYSAYRRHRPSAIGLFVGVAIGVCKAAAWALIAIVYWGLGRSQWHVARGQVFYWGRRCKYDLRLLSDDKWREMVLRDNWLAVELAAAEACGPELNAG